MAARPTWRPSPVPPSQTASLVNSEAAAPARAQAVLVDLSTAPEPLIHQVPVAGLEALELEDRLGGLDPPSQGGHLPARSSMVGMSPPGRPW